MRQSLPFRLPKPSRWVLGATVAMAGLIALGWWRPDSWVKNLSQQLSHPEIPPVLFLSGTVTETRSNSPPGRRRGQFELYVREQDYYFLRCWRGDLTNQGKFSPLRFVAFTTPLFQGQISGWSTWEMNVHDFHGTRSRRWGRYGTKGGGSFNEGMTNFLSPGSRLWGTNGFAGAREEGQINQEWYGTETFKDVVRVRGYLFPRRIEFTRGENLKVFEVAHYEFRDEPTVDWFYQQRDSLFSKTRSNSTSATAVDPCQEQEPAAADPPPRDP